MGNDWQGGMRKEDYPRRMRDDEDKEQGSMENNSGRKGGYRENSDGRSGYWENKLGSLEYYWQMYVVWYTRRCLCHVMRIHGKTCYGTRCRKYIREKGKGDR